MAAKTYLCKNPACSLGSMKDYGRFTGGITAEAVQLLTGAPLESLKKGEDYGDGFCPNCAAPGEAFDPDKAIAGALAEAEAQHAERVKAIKEGVA